MKHVGTKTFETNRLILRRFNIGDAQAMFNNWASDEEVTKYLIWRAHKDVSVSRAYIDYLIQSYSNPSTYEWGVELKETGQVIGSIGVVHCNDEINCSHIGYCIGKQWWNKGITSEAFAAVIAFLFNEVGVNRIESRHDIRNPNSGKVMIKCGLQYEGTLRESDVNNQGICDAAWYSLLKKDYCKD